MDSFNSNSVRFRRSNSFRMVLTSSREFSSRFLTSLPNPFKRCPKISTASLALSTLEIHSCPTVTSITSSLTSSSIYSSIFSWKDVCPSPGGGSFGGRSLNGKLPDGRPPGGTLPDGRPPGGRLPVGRSPGGGLGRLVSLPFLFFPFLLVR